MSDASPADPVPYMIRVKRALKYMLRHCGLRARWSTGETDIYRARGQNSVSIHGCGLRYAAKVGRAALMIIINVTTPYMPITTDGKEPNLDLVSDEIIEGVEKAARRAQRLVTHNGDKPLTQKQIIIDAIPAASAMCSTNGRHQFANRQLLYGVRPKVIEILGPLGPLGEKKLWARFCQVITEYESEHGPIPNMYRDPRGIIYHPHEGREIPLGTLEVEKYERPNWTFNKVLYCEKEGLFSCLRAERWPEKNDCALMTSKGFASRAARDLIDSMSESDQPLEFFCIHDADAAGTLIYQSIQNETAARPARKVQVINLGLEPEEALDMGLAIEQVSHDRKRPVADYVTTEWTEWLQTQRVELNAMPTAQFLEWLDRKMADYRGKVIPPADVLKKQLHNAARSQLHEQLTAEAIRNAKIDQRVDQQMKSLSQRFSKLNLPSLVRKQLTESPDQLWTKPLSEIAAQAIGGAQ